MVLCDDICRFLKDNGVDHTTGKVADLDVIYISEEASILPVSIRAKNLEEAAQWSASIESAASEITKISGEYPLIITEDRWHFRPEAMKARLLAHLQIFTQIYARNCEVRKIDKQTAAEFLAANHSYQDASCRYRYGLYLKRHTGHNAGHVDIAAGTLVAVATFSNARKWIKGEKTIRSYEWTRYASLPGVRLSGGMGKILKVFIEEVNPDDIMTYADLEWSPGKVYEALGFKKEGHKEPVCFKVDASWRRLPVKPAMTECTSLQTAATATSLREKHSDLFFQNLGSNKYRLKLTDYQ